MFASWPDLLRLLAVPAFGWVAYRDIRTRRVPNRAWYPLAALGVVLLAWEVGPLVLSGPTTLAEQRLLLASVLSIVVVVPLAYAFWLVGGFGGADAKAFFVIALLFPTFPHFALWQLGVEWLPSQLPVVRTTVGVFSLTILSNTVLAGAVYPVVLAARNAVAGRLSPAMFVARPVPAADTVSEYGTLLHFDDRRLREVRSLSGLRAYFSYRGLDLDALRMYLQYRGVSIADVRAEPDRYRDPATLPEDPNDPGGGVVTDGGQATEATTGGATSGSEAPVDYDDPWGAAAFLADIEGSAYGTSPGDLREGLDALATEEVVWVSPGIPFLVPLFVGLVVSLTLGDLLFVLLGLAGLV